MKKKEIIHTQIKMASEAIERFVLVSPKAELVWITPNVEDVICYCARVSAPQNQENKSKRLLKYCADNGHWSVFEIGNMCIEINTTRAISAQIIRHRSFSFQEFSQRYSSVNILEQNVTEECGARRQDTENKQNSIDDLSLETREWFSNAQNEVIGLSSKLYQEALDKGIAKECARFLLPMNTKTRLYMNGTIRSWIHYLQVRDAEGCQLEHRMIAKEIKEIFRREMPIIYDAIFA
jgi:thymidylate synthase (FAD)